MRLPGGAALLAARRNLAAGAAAGQVAFLTPDQSRDDAAQKLLEHRQISAPSISEDWAQFGFSCYSSLAVTAESTPVLYNIQLHTAGVAACTCKDWTHRGGACKHIRAAMLKLQALCVSSDDDRDEFDVVGPQWARTAIDEQSVARALFNFKKTLPKLGDFAEFLSSVASAPLDRLDELRSARDGVASLLSQLDRLCAGAKPVAAPPVNVHAGAGPGTTASPSPMPPPPAPVVCTTSTAGLTHLVGTTPASTVVPQAVRPTPAELLTPEFLACIDPALRPLAPAPDGPEVATTPTPSNANLRDPKKRPFADTTNTGPPAKRPWAVLPVSPERKQTRHTRMPVNEAASKLPSFLDMMRLLLSTMTAGHRGPGTLRMSSELFDGDDMLVEVPNEVLQQYRASPPDAKQKKAAKAAVESVTDEEDGRHRQAHEVPGEWRTRRNEARKSKTASTHPQSGTRNESSRRLIDLKGLQEKYYYLARGSSRKSRKLYRAADYGQKAVVDGHPLHHWVIEANNNFRKLSKTSLPSSREQRPASPSEAQHVPKVRRKRPNVPAEHHPDVSRRPYQRQPSAPGDTVDSDNLRCQAGAKSVAILLRNLEVYRHEGPIPDEWKGDTTRDKMLTQICGQAARSRGNRKMGAVFSFLSSKKPDDRFAETDTHTGTTVGHVRMRTITWYPPMNVRCGRGLPRGEMQDGETGMLPAVVVLIVTMMADVYGITELEIIWGIRGGFRKDHYLRPLKPDRPQGQADGRFDCTRAVCCAAAPGYSRTVV
ncbi:hypothetical protein AURDEDRAFT_122343 [Auricularia subglabra TFB-10046 SS5]|nr:hypothetical protein AURDEDRAFT_122343 [Auricularia subglabra TFB-10046 SS5]